MNPMLLVGLLALSSAALAQASKYAGDARNVVRYEVVSSCPVNVTYTVDNTNIRQEQGVKSGWTKTYPAKGTFVITSINAQLTCTGRVTVNVYRGGKRIATSTSSGAYAVAQAAK